MYYYDSYSRTVRHVLTAPTAHSCRFRILERFEARLPKAGELSMFAHSSALLGFCGDERALGCGGIGTTPGRTEQNRTAHTQEARRYETET